MSLGGRFEPVRAVQQLRACGVLETIRISAAGYPSRLLVVLLFSSLNVYAPLFHSFTVYFVTVLID